MHGDICPNTGLPTRECECWNWDPANPAARHPDQEEFERYCASARQRAASTLPRDAGHENLIASTVDVDNDGRPLYWSTTLGWTVFESATVFPDTTTPLPSVGVWVDACHPDHN